MSYPFEVRYRDMLVPGPAHYAYPAITRLDLPPEDENMLWTLWCAADALVESGVEIDLDALMEAIDDEFLSGTGGDSDFPKLPGWVAKNRKDLAIYPTK